LDFSFFQTKTPGFLASLAASWSIPIFWFLRFTFRSWFVICFSLLQPWNKGLFYSESGKNPFYPLTVAKLPIVFWPGCFLLSFLHIYRGLVNNNFKKIRWLRIALFPEQLADGRSNIFATH